MALKKIGGFVGTLREYFPLESVEREARKLRKVALKKIGGFVGTLRVYSSFKSVERQAGERTKSC